MDRCDACNAPSRVQVTVATGTLHFCAHCLNQHAAALAPRVLSFECGNLAEVGLTVEAVTRLLVSA